MGENVRWTYNARQAKCTPRRMYAENGLLHRMYMVKKQVRPIPKKRFRHTYIREWRKFRDLSLELVADRVGEATGEGFTHASLSRIERGLQPYSQPVLEALADALGTDPASLIMRSPKDSEGMWSIWDQAKPVQRELIVDLAKNVIKRAS